MSREDLSLGEARRIALAAQGFDRPRPNRRVNARDLATSIRRIGLLQIDPVNVLTPAHYQVLFSRLGPYVRPILDELVYKGREFTEQWAHEASIVPVENWPLLRHRMETHRVRPYGFESFLERSPAYVARVLDEVRARGPLTADDLADPEDVPRRIAGDAWVGTVPRAVLEAHFGRGLLAVADRRPNFARVFDLAERVVPARHHERKVDRQDAQRELLRLAARSCGIAAAEDLADYYRMPVREARPRIGELVESDELHEVRVAGWRAPAYLHREARLPRQIAAAALLSPFDPVVWYRPRTERLFEFEYRIEIYVPAEKRRWGYYCLPFLLGDRLVARVDLKADRAGGRLLVLAAYVEPHNDPRVVGEALGRELRIMAGWLGLGSVVVARRGNLARALGAAL
jgi:uncharacterized protein YcaQ